MTDVDPTAREQQPSMADRFKQEAERAKRGAADVREQISAAIDERRGGEATSVEDAKAKLEAARAGIDRDIATLWDRSPQREVLMDQLTPVGAAIAAAVGILGGGTALAKRRGAKRRHERALSQEAEAIAAAIRRLDQPDDGSAGRGWLRVLRLVIIGAVTAGAAIAVRRRSDDLRGLIQGPPPVARPMTAEPGPPNPPRHSSATDRSASGDRPTPPTGGHGA